MPLDKLHRAEFEAFLKHAVTGYTNILKVEQMKFKPNWERMIEARDNFSRDVWNKVKHLVDSQSQPIKDTKENVLPQSNRQSDNKST